MRYKHLSINELLELLYKYDHTELHVHHTHVPSHKDFNGNNHVALQDGMRNYHMNTRKFIDIAQHVTLFPDGTFLTGRDFGVAPASISGYNGKSNAIPFMVETLGSFVKGGDKLEGKQLDSLLQLAKHFDNRKKYIRFHKESASTQCPGDIDKNQFLKQVREYSSVSKPTTRYSDVPTTHWAYNSIESLSELGLLSGYSDGKFKPDSPMTRAEVATLVNSAIKYLNK